MYTCIYALLLACFEELYFEVNFVHCFQAHSADSRLTVNAHASRVKCVDLHPTEPLLLEGLHSGEASVWNYKTGVRSMIKNTFLFQVAVNELVLHNCLLVDRYIFRMFFDITITRCSYAVRKTHPKWCRFYVQYLIVCHHSGSCPDFRRLW